MAEYGRRGRGEEEEDEDEEDAERQPDVRKDDMLARRTGTHQKAGGAQAFNRFLPMPAARVPPPPQREPPAPPPPPAHRREAAAEPSRPKNEEYSEWNIKTARNWIGRRWGSA